MKCLCSSPNLYLGEDSIVVAAVALVRAILLAHPNLGGLPHTRPVPSAVVCPTPGLGQKMEENSKIGLGSFSLHNPRPSPVFS